MHPSLYPPPLPLLFLATSLHFTTSFSNSNGTFPGCDKTFNCGDIRDLTFPFTGGDRPEYCGPAEFRLSCRNGYAELVTMSVSYRVLRVDQTGRTLSLARSDLWNNTCSPELANSTLSSTYFNYNIDGNVDLTLFYGCYSPYMINPTNIFSCNVSGSNSSDSYYFYGPTPNDPILTLFKCTVNLRVPILQKLINELASNLTTLGEALMGGFNVNYTSLNDSECSMCLQSGGHCGFDSNSGQFMCFCGDRLCQPPGKKSNITTIGAGIFSACLAGLIFVFIAVICWLRKKPSSLKAIIYRGKDKKNSQKLEEFVKTFGSTLPRRYSYSDIKKMTKSLMEKLGEGGYGSVYKGKLSDGRLVAVKVLSESKSDGEDFINEVASISRTSHINVVSLIGFCLEDTRKALIYEFMPNGSLDKLIYNERFLEWEKLFQIAIGIARGLEYLHRGCNTRILHFDIKPQNILLDEDWCPKISDFGLAKLCKRKESIVSMKGVRGTAGYMAPEMFSRYFGGVSHKSDVYSYGMMVFEMVGGRKNFKLDVSKTSEIYFPFWVYKHLEVGEDFNTDGVLNEEQEEITKKMILVSFWCIQTNPMDRPSMSKVVDMLQGSLQSIETPPKPVLYSPTRSPLDSLTISSP